jgi:hypothetical protein
MDYHVPMRILHGMGDVHDQPDALFDAEAVVVGVPVDRHPVDVLHDQERAPVVREASVDHLGDARMAQRSQDLALELEPVHHARCVERQAEDLDGHGPLEHAVHALAVVDGAHASHAEDAADAIGSHDGADQRLCGLLSALGEPREGRLEQVRARSHPAVPGAVADEKQGPNGLEQLRVLAAGRPQERFALPGSTIEGLLEELIHLVPAVPDGVSVGRLDIVGSHAGLNRTVLRSGIRLGGWGVGWDTVS